MNKEVQRLTIEEAFKNGSDIIKSIYAQHNAFIEKMNNEAVATLDKTQLKVFNLKKQEFYNNVLESLFNGIKEEMKRTLNELEIKTT